MDFYANASLGPWTVNNENNRQVSMSRRRKNLHTEKISSGSFNSNLDSKDGCGGESTECCGKCHQENLHKINKKETSEQEHAENYSNDRKQHSEQQRSNARASYILKRLLKYLNEKIMISSVLLQLSKLVPACCKYLCREKKSQKGKAKRTPTYPQQFHKDCK